MLKLPISKVSGCLAAFSSLLTVAPQQTKQIRSFNKSEQNMKSESCRIAIGMEIKRRKREREREREAEKILRF